METLVIGAKISNFYLGADPLTTHSKVIWKDTEPAGPSKWARITAT